MLTVHGLLHVEKKNALRKHPSLKHLYQFIVQSRPEFDVLNKAQHIIVDTEYVSKQIEQLHVREKISHLPWMYVIPQEELLRNYQTASIYALHSQEESQGIALVEALAAGLPVVSTMVGGIPYVVKDGETGLLSVYSNIDSFARHMIRLLEDKDLRDKMAKSAREIAQNYSWKNIVQAIEIVYNRVITSKIE